MTDSEKRKQKEYDDLQKSIESIQMFGYPIVRPYPNPFYSEISKNTYSDIFEDGVN